MKLKKLKKVFAKGDSLTHSKEVYLVIKVKRNRIFLKNLATNKDLEESFNPKDLSRVVDVDQIPLKNSSEQLEHRATKTARKALKKAEEEGIDAANILPESSQRVSREELEEEPEWEVESIVDQAKGKNGKNLYKVHWKGWDESTDTWEPLKNIRNTIAYEKWLARSKYKIHSH